MWLSFLLLFALAVCARADPGGGAGPGGGQGVGDDERSSQGREEDPKPNDAEPAPPEAPPAPLSMDDARVNFETLVSAFVTQRSGAGYWPLRDKAAKRVRRLKLVSMDLKKVKKVRDGRYAGPVIFTDLDQGKKLETRFTVDLSGPEWRVVGMTVPKPKKKK